MDQQPNEVHQAMTEAFRSWAMVGSQLVDVHLGRRMERDRALRADADQKRSEFTQRLRAEREAAKPTINRAWDRGWWRQASPEDVARTWYTTAEWANNHDPLARAALDEMRHEIKARYGVEIPPWQTPPPGEIAALLAGPDAFEADADGPDAFPATGRTADVVITTPVEGSYNDGDLYTYQRDLARDTITVPDGMTLEEAAAEYLADQAAADPSRFGDSVRVNVYPAGQGEQARVVSRPYGAYGNVRAEWESPDPLLELGREQARQILDTGDARRADILDGAVEASAQEQRDAALGALHRAEHGERNYGREYLKMRVSMSEAEMRGEDPEFVPQAAVLAQHLDEEWWETANDAEIAGVFEYVEAWPEGQARSSAHSRLRTAMLERSNLQGEELDQWLTRVREARARTLPEDLAADELTARAADEQAASTIAGELADGTERTGQRSRSREERMRQRALRATALQDRAAARDLEQAGDEAAVDAVKLAMSSFVGSPSQRLNGTLKPAATTRPRQSARPRPRRTQTAARVSARDR